MIPVRPCVDCPAAWSQAQRAAGLCNGRPGTYQPDAPAQRVARDPSERRVGGRGARHVASRMPLPAGDR
jgi:hypothetical protein